MFRVTCIQDSAQLDALLLKILAMVLKATEEDGNFTRDSKGF